MPGHTLPYCYIDTQYQYHSNPKQQWHYHTLKAVTSCMHLWVKVENAYFAGVYNLSYGLHTCAKQLFLIFTILYKPPFSDISLKGILRNEMIFTTINFTITHWTTCVYNIHRYNMLLTV